MDDQIIRLILDMGASGANVQDVHAKLQSLKGSVITTADIYEVLERQVGTYDLVAQKAAATTQQLAQAQDVSAKAIQRLTIGIDQETVALDEQVRKAVEATSTQRALARALDDGGAAKAATANMKGLNMAMVGAAYGAQDFVAVMSMGGGVGRALMSVSNNITPILMGLGLGGGMAGVLGLVVTAGAAAVPVIEKLGFSLDTSIKTKIPESTDKITRLTDAIKRNKEAIEELTKQRDLDYFQMEKYKGLVGDLAQKEQDLATARAARAVGAGQSKATRERASAFRSALEEYGGSDKLLGALGEAGLSQAEAEERVADALKGAKNAIESIKRTLAAQGGQNQILYVDPVEAERRKRRTEATDAILADNARKLRERKQEEERAKQQNLREVKAEQKAHTDEQKAAAKNKLKMPSAAQLRKGDEGIWQREAVALEQRAAQTGMTPAIAARLRRLREKLGKDMPTMEQAMAMQQMAQQQMVSNQASFEQRLRAAQAIVQEARRINRQLQQPATNNGWN